MPGDRGQRGADDEGEADRAVGVDAEQPGHPQILLAGAHRAAKRSPGDEVGEEREQRHRGEHMMAICIQEICTRNASVSHTPRPPGTSWVMGLLRAPWLTWTKFCSRIDMPMALISGARRNEPRSGR